MRMLIIAALAGCKDGSGVDSVPSDYTAETVPLAGACPQDAVWGRFQVYALQQEGYSGVVGQIQDGMLPALQREVASEEGDCVLLQRSNPFCEDPCGADETCDHDGTCVPTPRDQDLGTVRVFGLLGDVEMEPVAPGYLYFDTSLPHPGFSPGSLITLQADGEVLPEPMYGGGVDVISGSGQTWTLEEGKDLELSWDAPAGEPVRSEMFLELSIDQHGATPLSLQCFFEDSGSATVPASVIDGLIGAGVTGFPYGAMERRTVDSQSVGAGCAELQVTSGVVEEVDVVGFTPCRSDVDCPEGQTCNLEIEICE